MALYAFDGTGNKDKKRPERDSNVRKFFEVYEKAYADKKSKYVEGIGSGHLPVISSVKKAVGGGGKKKVKKGREALEENLANGDTDIDVVGFSRGAAEALQFVNDIQNETIEGVKGRSVRFLGLWDTVASFGNPLDDDQPNWDLGLPGNVKKCCHALALDERRGSFPVTRQAAANAFEARRRGIHEVWFRGYHSDVGGGNDNEGLSNIPLVWMFRRANGMGSLTIPAKLFSKYVNACNPGAKPKKPKDPKENPKRAIRQDDVVHASVFTIPPDPDKKKFQANNPKPGMRIADYEGNILPNRFMV